MWKVESYQSGTVVVTNVEDLKSPHFYVYGKTGSTDSERYNIAIDLATWINYPNRMPVWALELKVHPDTNTCLITDSGISITATGPMVLPENDNGALNWMESYSDEAKYAREQLINNLLFNRKNTAFAYSLTEHANPSYKMPISIYAYKTFVYDVDDLNRLDLDYVASFDDVYEVSSMKKTIRKIKGIDGVTKCEIENNRFVARSLESVKD